MRTLDLVTRKFYFVGFQNLSRKENCKNNSHTIEKRKSGSYKIII